MSIRLYQPDGWQQKGNNAEKNHWFVKKKSTNKYSKGWKVYSNIWENVIKWHIYLSNPIYIQLINMGFYSYLDQPCLLVKFILNLTSFGDLNNLQNINEVFKKKRKKHRSTNCPILYSRNKFKFNYENV